MKAALEEALGVPVEDLGFGAASADESWLAPAGFPASALAGRWVTAYQFPHAGQQLHHADIACVTAEDERRVSIINGPACTEGRAVPFLNEITAELSGRHLVGHWCNTSDTRYWGLFHVAVQPGEMMMQGWFTGLASDVAVSMGAWTWVRLDGDPDGITLLDPAVIHKLVMSRSPYDAPLTAADIGEEAC